MGFGSWVSGAWKKVKKGASKVGEFVKDKALPVIGKISEGARKVGEVIARPEIQAVLGALEMVPVVGRVATAIKKGGELASKAGALGGRVQRFGEGVVSAVENRDLSNVKELFEEGRGIYGDVKGFRNR